MSEKSNLSLIYGIHPVTAILHKQIERVQELFISTDNAKVTALSEIAHQNRIKVTKKSKQEMDKLIQGNHQGIIARATPNPVLTDKQLDHQLALIKGTPLILILDTIQDPHNLGACLRSADAFNVDLVIVPKDKSVGLTPTVTKVASGAADIIPFMQVTNLARTITDLQQNNIWIKGLAGEAEKTLYQSDLTIPTALVLGSEHKGLRELTRKKCDELIKIPMQGSVTSLNVSVATGIALAETTRQRCQ